MGWGERQGVGTRTGPSGAWMPSDLDRCEHGRHEGDVCTFPNGGCGGVSHGNPHMDEHRVIGYMLDGRPIIVEAP